MGLFNYKSSDIPGPWIPLSGSPENDFFIKCLTKVTRILKNENTEIDEVTFSAAHLS